MRPGDLVLVTQRRTGVRELMVSIDPCLLPGRIYAGPCTYSVFLNCEGKIEKLLNELHIYSVVQAVPSGPETV